MSTSEYEKINTHWLGCEGGLSSVSMPPPSLTAAYMLYLRMFKGNNTVLAIRRA